MGWGSRHVSHAGFRGTAEVLEYHRNGIGGAHAGRKVPLGPSPSKAVKRAQGVDFRVVSLRAVGSCSVNEAP